jgi:isopentenyl-diphosphate delta-isomerase
MGNTFSSFVATTTDALDPDPAEVEDATWVDWAAFRSGVLDGSRAISPWCRDQVALLPEQPLGAAGHPDSALPPAARTA